ncbi:MAG: 3-oxoacyl-ACP synthase [Spirochaetaceae bacterium]|nr:3-oxoacyl-ACP synthase [Spirochaetaceae bacterium]
MHVGIIGLGTWLPEHFTSAAELSAASGVPEEVIAKKMGVNRKPVASAAESTGLMGLEAARKAVAVAGIAPEEIDLVIWCGAQHKDYPCWLAGLYVSERLGAKRAWSFDMEAMCGSMMTALEVAKSLMLAREDLRTVLLVSGYRNNDLIDPAEPATRFMLDIGSGGSALVLRKNAGRNAVLASAFRGDGSLSEMCVVPTLGTKAWPPRDGDLERAHFTVPDEGAFKGKLGEVTMPNFYAVIREAVARSGIPASAPRGGIDYLAILHFKRSAHEAVLAELGLGPERTTYLEDYGHIGQNDQVLSLELGLAAGKVRDGDNVVFVGAGLGFVWASTVIRWGPCAE